MRGKLIPEAHGFDGYEGWPKYYNDQGCQYAPKCLSCPFAECFHDNPAAFLAARKEEAMRALCLDDYREGFPPKEIAVRRGLHVRTIYRYVAKEWRKEGG